jgi:hypothetical protein
MQNCDAHGGAVNMLATAMFAIDRVVFILPGA